MGRSHAISTTAPTKPMTIDEFHAFATASDQWWELVGGHPIMAPTEVPENSTAATFLVRVLDRHLPATYVAYHHASVRLHGTPPTVRVPDVAVYRPTAQNTGWLNQPDGIALVIENLSPSTRSTDLLTKRDEYAAAGIPNYLIIDVTHPDAPHLTLHNRLTDTPNGTRYTDTPHTGDHVTLHIDDHTVPLHATDLVRAPEHT